MWSKFWQPLSGPQRIAMVCLGLFVVWMLADFIHGI